MAVKPSLLILLCSLVALLNNLGLMHMWISEPIGPPQAGGRRLHNHNKSTSNKNREGQKKENIMLLGVQYREAWDDLQLGPSFFFSKNTVTNQRTFFFFCGFTKLSMKFFLTKKPHLFFPQAYFCCNQVCDWSAGHVLPSGVCWAWLKCLSSEHAATLPQEGTLGHGQAASRAKSGVFIRLNLRLC